jgi:predicted RND superfamily exporter protein
MRVLIRPLLRGVATMATERPVLVLALWAALSVVALVAIPRIVIDTDYLTFFGKESRVRREFALVNELIVGAIPIYVTLGGDEEGIFREPANLRTVKNLQHRIDKLAGVSATLSVVDLIEILNRVVERDRPEAERIPDSRGEVADLVFMIPKSKLRRFANSNHSGVNILVRTGATGSTAVLGLERQLKQAIASEELPDGARAEVTGNAIVLNQAAYGMARDQFTTVGFAAVAILVLITAAFRSLRLGFLAMIPNVIPVLMFFGTLGIGVATLSLPTSMIGCVALGIAIDDTAHFLVGHRHRRTQGMPSQRAAADCVQALGLPIVTTSLMLVAGFLVLTLSGFATLKEFGYLSALTMFICLSADLLLLPAVLVRGRV